VTPSFVRTVVAVRLFGTEEDPILWLRVAKVGFAIGCALATLLYAIYLAERRVWSSWARKVRRRFTHILRRRTRG